MRYKLFGFVQDFPHVKVTVEYENDKIIGVHYLNKQLSYTTDIWLLKNDMYLICTFYWINNKYCMRYINNFELMRDNRWRYKSIIIEQNFDSNIDVIK